MASVTGSWIEKTILQHDKYYGANLAIPWLGKRFCQVTSFEAPFDDSIVCATISDETHTVKASFNLNSVQAFEFKRLNSTTPTKALRSRIRAIFQVEELLFRLVPRRGRSLPEIVLQVISWDIYNGDSTNPLLWPDARPLCLYESADIRKLVHKWFTGHSDSSPVQSKPEITMPAASMAGPSRQVEPLQGCTLTSQQPAPTFITNFLQPYLFPPNGAKQSTVPEWIFTVTPEDRGNLDSMSAFPLIDDDMQRDAASLPPSSPPESIAPGSLATDRKGKRKASPAPPTPSFPPLGQPIPSYSTLEDSGHSSHRRQETSDVKTTEAHEIEGMAEKFLIREIDYGEPDAERLSEADRDSAEDSDIGPVTAMKRPRRMVKSRSTWGKRDPMALFSQSTAPSSQPEPEDTEASQSEDNDKGSQVDPLGDIIPDDQLSDYARGERNERRNGGNAAPVTEPERLVADGLRDPTVLSRPSLQDRPSEQDLEAVERMSSLAEGSSQPRTSQRSSPTKPTLKSSYGSQAKSQEHTESFDASEPSNEDFSLSRYETRYAMVEIKRDPSSTPTGRQLDDMLQIAASNECVRRRANDDPGIDPSPRAVIKRELSRSPPKPIFRHASPANAAAVTYEVAEHKESASLPPPPDDLPRRYGSPHESRRSTFVKAFTPQIVPGGRPLTPMVSISALDGQAQTGPDPYLLIEGGQDVRLTSRTQRLSTNERYSASVTQDVLHREHSTSTDEEAMARNDTSVSKGKLDGFVLDLWISHGVSYDLVRGVLETIAKDAR